MTLFHFDNNRKVRLYTPLVPAESSANSSNTKFDNSVWDGEFEKNLIIGDTFDEVNGNKSKKQNVDKNGREYKEHHTLFIQYSLEEFNHMSNGEKWKEIQNRYIDKEKNRLREKFPESKYDVEITVSGDHFEIYIYEKEYASLKKSNPQKLQQSADEFFNGNFDVINTIENPVEFLETYRKKSGGKTMYSAMISAYNEGKLSSDEIIEYLNTLHEKFWDFEYEYDEQNPKSKLGGTNIGGTYFNLYNRVKKYFQREQELQTKYGNNNLDREQVKELQKFIKENYDIELNEIAAAQMLEDFGKYSVTYDKNKILEFLNSSDFDYEFQVEMIKHDKEKHPGYYSEYKIDTDTANYIKQIFKNKTNFDITDNEAAFLYYSYEWKGEEKHYDLEKLKADCLNGEKVALGCECRDYLENILTYAGNGYNDSIESLEDVAQTTEMEFSRYNFDTHKSPIADLVRKSEKMIIAGERELSVTKKDNKIIIKNKLTGKERVIDLNILTSNLDNEYKKLLINALNGFNKISLWEFAIEITNTVGNDIKSSENALAKYNKSNDKISISKNADSNVLLHEMVHAIMATIIDGVNTSNEPLFKEFVETFNEEQKAHKYEKQLRNSILKSGNYNYCAENIHEFTAEAGCLWLSGKSDSEFTIATHFPKSYRLFVQLIEKIRTQETGRSTNEKL